MNRSKTDDDRQDNGSQREDGEAGDYHDSAQGPWKVLAQSAAAVPAATSSAQETTGNFFPLPSLPVIYGVCHTAENSL
jgi:hypothetical protein